MPTLNWIGKEAVVKHHLQVPFRLLKDVPDLACGPPDANVEDEWMEWSLTRRTRRPRRI